MIQHKLYYSNMLLLTQVYKWVPALARKVAGLLCGALATLSQQCYKLSSLAQSLVKRRWAPLDALKSFPTKFTFLPFTRLCMVIFFICRQTPSPWKKKYFNVVTGYSKRYLKSACTFVWFTNINQGIISSWRG